MTRISSLVLSVWMIDHEETRFPFTLVAFTSYSQEPKEPVALTLLMPLATGSKM
jgi:hypothetical protein